MENKDWNYDRITSAHALIAMTQNDMMITLNRGVVSKGMKLRMAEFLKNAAQEIEAMVCE